MPVNSAQIAMEPNGASDISINFYRFGFVRSRMDTLQLDAVDK